MLIHLHNRAIVRHWSEERGIVRHWFKNNGARRGPKVRRAIRASTEPASVLAERFGTTGQTVYKWKHRDTVHDRSHTPHRLQSEAEMKTIRGIVFPPNADPGAGFERQAIDPGDQL